MCGSILRVARIQGVVRFQNYYRHITYIIHLLFIEGEERTEYVEGLSALLKKNLAYSILHCLSFYPIPLLYKACMGYMY